MADPKTPVVKADTDISGKKQRKPKGSINWLKLGVDKDPEFGTQYFLFVKIPADKKDYQVGALAGITSTKEGKKYSFFVEGLGDQERNNFTHYALATEPVEIITGNKIQ
jgi:hypothetical protein